MHSFPQRAVSNLPELKGITPRPLKNIALIGGGTMGAGIATSALLSGLNVTVLEMNKHATQAAFDRIENNLSGAKKRGKIDSQQYENIVNHSLKLVTDYGKLSDMDLVIEAVFEEMAVKKTGI